MIQRLKHNLFLYYMTGLIGVAVVGAAYSLLCLRLFGLIDKGEFLASFEVLFIGPLVGMNLFSVLLLGGYRLNHSKVALAGALMLVILYLLATCFLLMNDQVSWNLSDFVVRIVVSSLPPFSFLVLFLLGILLKSRHDLN